MPPLGRKSRKPLSMGLSRRIIVSLRQWTGTCGEVRQAPDTAI